MLSSINLHHQHHSEKALIYISIYGKVNLNLLAYTSLNCKKVIHNIKRNEELLFAYTVILLLLLLFNNIYNNNNNNDEYFYP